MVAGFSKLSSGDTVLLSVHREVGRIANGDELSARLRIRDSCFAGGRERDAAGMYGYKGRVIF